MQHAVRDDRLSDAGQPARGAVQAGRYRARLGGRRRVWALRGAADQERRWDARSVSSARAEGADLLERLGCDLILRRDELGLDGLGEARWASASVARSAVISAKTPTSSSSMSAERPSARRCIVVRRGGTVCHLRIEHGLSARVRQSPSMDAPEARDRQPRSQLAGGL